jgi:hypothetical protein
MSSAYAPQPEKHPERVPPNRRSPKTAILPWILILSGFVAFYRYTSPPVPTAAPLNDEAPPPPARVPWPFALPLATLVGLSALFVRTRARLPASYRTGELRTLKAEAPEAPAAPPSFEPMELQGKGQERPVTLRIDEAGFHWSAEARLLQQEQWLDIEWDELKGFGQGKIAAPGISVALWLLVAGVFIAFHRLFSAPAQQSMLANVLSIGLLVVGVFAYGSVQRRFSHGTLTLVTETHHLTFQSRQLSEERRDQLRAIVKARRPELVPESTASGWQALQLLFLRPFAELRRLFQSDAELTAYVRATATTTIDDETALAGAIQHKLYALWSGGWCALLPVSTGLAFALWLESIPSFVPGFLVAWFFGFVLSTRWMKSFARLSGVSLIRS